MKLLGRVGQSPSSCSSHIPSPMTQDMGAFCSGRIARRSTDPKKARSTSLGMPKLMHVVTLPACLCPLCSDSELRNTVMSTICKRFLTLYLPLKPDACTPSECTPRSQR